MKRETVAHTEDDILKFQKGIFTNQHQCPADKSSQRLRQQMNKNDYAQKTGRKKHNMLDSQQSGTKFRKRERNIHGKGPCTLALRASQTFVYRAAWTSDHVNCR